MRTSVLRRNQRAIRIYEVSTRRRQISRSFESSPSPLSACRACYTPLYVSATQRRPVSRMFHSASAKLGAASIEDIKSNPIPQTHYEFFPKTLPGGPPPIGPFHIDIRDLRKEFLQLQAVAHPDRHSSELKSRAEATSARINEAYKTLQNPLLRAQYLLGLRGIDVAEDESAKVEDPELLMEVLETRETIEDAQEERELAELRQVNDRRIEFSEGILDRAFRDDDVDTAKSEVVRLRYWVNIKQSIDGWEKGKPVVLAH